MNADRLGHRGHGGDTETTEDNELLCALRFELRDLCDEIEILIRLRLRRATTDVDSLRETQLVGRARLDACVTAPERGGS